MSAKISQMHQAPGLLHTPRIDNCNGGQRPNVANTFGRHATNISNHTSMNLRIGPRIDKIMLRPAERKEQPSNGSGFRGTYDPVTPSKNHHPTKSKSLIADTDGDKRRISVLMNMLEHSSANLSECRRSLGRCRRQPAINRHILFAMCIIDTTWRVLRQTPTRIPTEARLHIQQNIVNPVFSTPL